MHRAPGPPIAGALAALLSLAAAATGGCADPPPPDGVSPALAALCRGELALPDPQCVVIAGWRLPDALPPARGNAHADDADAATLGHAIFFDEGFSSVPGVSCVTCHRPELAFQDALAVSEVIEGAPGARNSPTLLNVGWSRGYFFWDGRADSLWSQPLFAMENDIEMASSRLAVAHRIHDVAAYREAYEALFGALPPLEDDARFPPDGRPGDAQWEAMTAADREAVDRVAANVGKALEAYMRRIAAGSSRVDAYLDGDADALDETEARGLSRFVLGGCTYCHDGPSLTDERFHPSTVGGGDDRGRAAGIELLLTSPFNGRGPHFDADAGEPLPLPDAPGPDDERAFRTPSMRNVAATAPYQHDGSRSMQDILSVQGLLYEEGDEQVMEAFLRALDGAPPPAEWAAPPAR